MASIRMFSQTAGEWVGTEYAAQRLCDYRRKKDKSIIACFCESRDDAVHGAQWRPVYLRRPNLFVVRSRPWRSYRN